MTEEHTPQPGYNPDYHVSAGTTVDFAHRVVTGTCYDFEPGQELQCRRCGGRDTTRVSPAGGPIRCDDGPVARDAGITKCAACNHAYIWRICGN